MRIPPRRSPRRLTAALLGVVAIAVVAAGCIPVAGGGFATNGRLPDSALYTVSPECRVANDIATQFTVMLAHANAQGIALAPEKDAYLPPGVVPPEKTACYRSYDMQVWWRNWYCFIGQCNLAAVPGTSKHGWGRAVDLQDQFGQMTFSSPGYHWLVANAANYGFYQPPNSQQGGGSPEAWHWVHD